MERRGEQKTAESARRVAAATECKRKDGRSAEAWQGRVLLCVRGALQLELGPKRGIVVSMSVEEIKKGIESLSEAELGEVASFLSDLRREVSGRLAPDELGKLAHRLAGNKSRADSERLTSEIVDGFYSGS